MVDWKKIRDVDIENRERTRTSQEAQEEMPWMMDAVEQSAVVGHNHRINSFPSLISALEEQEKRIEFLEKALEQSIYAADIKIEDNYIVFELDAPAGSEPSTTINWFKPDTLPCLAKYLEEKNV